MPFVVGVTEVSESWKSRVQDGVWVHLKEDKVAVSSCMHIGSQVLSALC